MGKFIIYLKRIGLLGLFIFTGKVMFFILLTTCGLFIAVLFKVVWWALGTWFYFTYTIKITYGSSIFLCTGCTGFRGWTRIVIIFSYVMDISWFNSLLVIVYVLIINKILVVRILRLIFVIILYLVALWGLFYNMAVLSGALIVLLLFLYLTGCL